MHTISQGRAIRPVERSGLLIGRGMHALLLAGVRIVDTILAWHDRKRQRSHLQQLDDRLLRDMGLSRADVEREVTKPFWRV